MNDETILDSSVDPSVDDSAVEESAKVPTGTPKELPLELQESQAPLVSIIVRTKDRPKLLKNALKSISAQTYRPIEVVLVNDGGTEPNESEIREYLGDVSLNYIHLPDNVGRAKAGNHGIEKAAGMYIGFLDDDDEFYPEHVDTLVGLLQKSDVKVAYTDSMMVYKEYDPEKREIVESSREVVFSEDFEYYKLLFDNFIPFMCLLFHRGVIKPSGGFSPDLELYEDWDLLIRIGQKYPFEHIKTITANYNQWSAECQISQANKDPGFVRDAYLKVVSLNMEQITPERINRYVERYISMRLFYKRSFDEIKVLKDAIDKQNEAVAKMDEENRRKEIYISKIGNDYSAAMIEKENHIQSLNNVVKERDVRILELDSEVRKRDVLLHALTNTRGYRALDKARRVRNRISAGSLINTNDIVRSVNVLKKEGPVGLIRKAGNRFHFYKNRGSVNMFKTLDASKSFKVAINAYKTAIENPLDVKVSVIIPTKNGGVELDYVLRRITQQEGIREIELITIDSGSRDNTVDICKSYTRYVYSIDPATFHHAKTRNMGAEKATGDFLVFITQDAIPVGNQWLYKLILPVLNDQASAVSVKQILRCDADLFSTWANINHNDFMQFHKDRVSSNQLFKNFNALDIQSKRINAGLDNVCMGIRKAVFDKYKFTTGYAEDLDLGIRLILDGYKLMFQASNAVIHSHNRPPLYFLKRSYVDSISLSELLNVGRASLNVGEVLESISCLYSVLKVSMASLDLTDIAHGEIGEVADGRQGPTPCRQGPTPCRQGPTPGLLHVVEGLAHNLNSRLALFDGSWQMVDGDKGLDSFFADYQPVKHLEIVKEINSDLLHSLRFFASFLNKHKKVIEIKDIFRENVYKIYANMAGSYLGTHTTELFEGLAKGI